MDDDGGHHENARHKAEQYKASAAQGQWLMQPQQPSMKHIMAIIAERDAAIQERNLAVSEKKAALAERDMAFLQRDNAIQERNNVIIERDHALSSLQYRGEVSYNNTNNTLLLTALPPLDPPKSSRALKRPSKEKKGGGPRKEAAGPMKAPEWKVRDLGLNQVAFDDSTMPCPGCSCTGMLRQCYKWGNGGWQSSCCTTTMSMHPLPAVPNKRHARIGGRKMSGSAFSKLLSRLAAQGHDLSVSVDLKEHWAKHGTNRYITIK